jgi:hypothetical protein
MDAESQLLQLLTNEFHVDLAEGIYGYFGIEPNLIENFTTGLKHKLDTEFCRKSSGLTHMDIHNPKI